MTAQAAKSTRAHALEVISDDRTGGDQPVWVVQVAGAHRFTCIGCHRPPGAPSPRGRFLTLVLDAQTLVQSDFGIGDVKADLSRLGEVLVLVDKSR